MISEIDSQLFAMEKVQMLFENIGNTDYANSMRTCHEQLSAAMNEFYNNQKNLCSRLDIVADHCESLNLRPMAATVREAIKILSKE